MYLIFIRVLKFCSRDHIWFIKYVRNSYLISICFLHLHAAADNWIQMESNFKALFFKALRVKWRNSTPNFAVDRMEIFDPPWVKFEPTQLMFTGRCCTLAPRWVANSEVTKVVKVQRTDLITLISLT